VTFDTGSSFKNLATGVWNWSLTPDTGFDTDVLTVLDLFRGGKTHSTTTAPADQNHPSHHVLKSFVVCHGERKTRTAAGDNCRRRANLVIQKCRRYWTSAQPALYRPDRRRKLDSSQYLLLYTGDREQLPSTEAVPRRLTHAGGETFNNLTVNTGGFGQPRRVG